MTNQTTSNRKETKYNKVVNIAEDGEITVLDGVFNYKDGFKGAIGSKFYPVSKSEYDAAIDDENVIDYLVDSGIELTADQKRNGFVGMVEQMDNSEKASLMFDESYSELWDYLREECNLTEDEAHIFNCVGGGRCFDAKFKGNKNKELSAIIRKYESK